jgi:hypothetical protein
VYETHARVAIECGDLNEYNQCACRLRDLYTTSLGKEHGAVDEFNGYMILYAEIHHDLPTLIRSLSTNSMPLSTPSPRSSSSSSSSSSPSYIQRLFNYDHQAALHGIPANNINNSSSSGGGNLSKIMDDKKKSKKNKNNKNKAPSSSSSSSFSGESLQLIESLPTIDITSAGYQISKYWGTCTKHALSVVLAIRQRNFHTFFKLYSTGKWKKQRTTIVFFSSHSPSLFLIT